MKYPHPANEEAFEEFTIHLLRRLWNSQQVERYGRRGQRQHGVDILDFSGTTPFRAAQCKQHSRGIALLPKELRGEVTKARAFPTKLDIYYFLTTADRSTDCQLELLRINRRHRAQGLFTVELLTWESIERLLDDYPELQEYLITVPLPTVTRVIAGGQGAILTSITALRGDIALTRGQDAIEGDLQDARFALDRHDYQMAHLLLNRIRSKHWEQATPVQRFRLLVNTGTALSAANNYAEAGRSFLQATLECPHDERAPAIAAQAHELLEDKAQAFTLATAALLALPTSSKAAAVRVRTAPDDLPWDALVASIPPSAMDGEVAAALASRALAARRFDTAQEYAALATTRSPDWPIGWLLLGHTLVMREGAKFFARGLEDRSLDRSSLRQSEHILSTTFDLAKRVANTSAQADALVLRSKARDMGGAVSAAAEDIEAAYQLTPQRPDVLFARAGFLQQRGDSAGAIRSLRLAIAGGADRSAAFILATLLYASGDQNSRREATNLFRELAQDRDAPYQDEAALYVARELTTDGSGPELEVFIKQVLPYLAPPCQDLLGATVANARGQSVEAERLAMKAVATITVSTSTGTIRGLARLLTSLGRYDDALPLFQRFVVPGVESPDLHQYIAVADRLGRMDLVLKEYEVLRAAGVQNEEFFHNEVSILERLDPQQAVERLRAHLSEHPQDKVAVLRMSMIGLRLGRLEIVVSDPSALPSATEAEPDWLSPIVQVLRRSGRHMEAARFAYRALRHSFAQPEAHKAFFQALFPSTGLTFETDMEFVTPESAVRYVEEGSQDSVWLVLEDDPDCDPGRNEIDGSSGVARRLLGKKVGDSIQLTDGAVQERVGTVTEILHKYVYRLRDVMEKWQIRFSDDSSIQSVRLDTEEDASGNKLDLDPILRVVDSRHDLMENSLRTYVSRPCPIHVVASALGTDDVSMTINLSSRPDMPIRTYWGAVESYQKDREAALAELVSSLSPVMDATAVATIVHLGFEGDLGTSPKWAKVTQSVVDHVEGWVLEMESPMLGTLGKRRDGYVRTEITPRQREEELARRRASSSRLKESVELFGVLELAGVPPVVRQKCEPLFGTGGLEAMVKGSRPGFVLWTDDWTVGAAAREQFGARSISTEVVLRHWMDVGRIDVSRYLKACAKLIAWKYSPIPLSPDVCVAAAEEAGWQPSEFPLAGNLDMLATNDLDTRSVLVALVRLVPAMYRSVALATGRDIFMEALLLRLATRSDGREVVHVLLGVLDRAFGVDVAGCLEAGRQLRAWLSRQAATPQTR